MDPIAQLGWVHRSAEAEGPAADLVRDAFHAVDLMHEDAMSQIGGNSSSGDEREDGVDAAGEESDSQSTDRNSLAVSAMDGDPQVSHASNGVNCSIPE